MAIEVIAIGGYGEVGRNMTAVRCGEDVVILDMGLHMPNYIKVTEEEEATPIKITEETLLRANAVPNDRAIKNLWKNTKAIVISHAHLDHAGATPYLAPKYKAPIICTPYTARVLTSILKDERLSIPNEIIPVPPNSRIKINNFSIQFVYTTHSTPQTVIVALNTKEGIVVYGNDYKLDSRPVLGKKPNYALLEKIGRAGVKALIQDCLYAWDPRKMPSESVAREMLRDVMLGVETKGKALVVTTFASHIARLKSIVEFAKELGRKVVFLGRSLAKYVYAAEEAEIAYFSKEVEIAKWGSQVKRILKKVMREGKHKYCLVVTGHQGEQKSILSKLATGQLPWHFDPGDVVIFSCTVIPVEINRMNRERLESELTSRGVRIFKDIHVSGHCAREDLRDIISLLSPQHLIPTHGAKNMIEAFNTLAREMGYEQGKNLHILRNGNRLTLA